MPEPDSWDLLNWDCSDLTGWTDDDSGTAVSEISPAGQLRLDTNAAGGGSRYASRYQDIGSIPNTFTVEIKTYFDLLGTMANNAYAQLQIMQADEGLLLHFASDDVQTYDNDSGFVSVGNLAKTGASVEWQIWRILVTFTGTTGEGTCDIYLYDSTHVWSKVGTGIACSYESATPGNGYTRVRQRAIDDADRLTHIDYLKIATGLFTPTTFGTINGLSWASVKSVNGQLKSVTKTINGWS
jgi:hypothetical protein